MYTAHPAPRFFALVAALAAIGTFVATQPATAAEAATQSELQQDREAIDAGKAKVAELRAQVDANGKAIEQERADLQAMEADVKTLREETEKLKKSATTGAPYKFNEAANKYNAKAQEAIDRRNALDASISRYNELVGQLREQTKVVNDLVIAYNEKLARKAN
jgi:chromosome segregation ATPase